MLSEVLRRDTLSQAGRARGQSEAAKFGANRRSLVLGWRHRLRRPRRVERGVGPRVDRPLQGLVGHRRVPRRALWAEPYFCDTLLVKYAGHVVFDYSIPLCFISYLAVASRMAPRGAKAKAA